MKRCSVLIVLVLAACPAPESMGGTTESTSEGVTGDRPTEGFSSSAPVEECADLSCPGLLDCTKIGALCVVQGLSEDVCWLQVERLCRLSQVAGDLPISPGYSTCEALRATHILLNSGYNPDKAWAECDAISPAASPEPVALLLPPQ